MIHCFYHSADLDGHCSGAIVKYRFPEAIMHPINYGDEFPWDEIKPPDTVFLVDFCLQPDSSMMALSDFLAGTGELHWIDHHKSQEHLTSKMLHWQGYFNTTKAACELTWEYLFPDRPVPLAVHLLGRYDVWDHSDDRVLPFQMFMRMQDTDPARGKFDWEVVLDDLWPDSEAVNTFIGYAIRDGRLLLRYDEEQKRRYVATYGFETTLEVGPHDVFCNSVEYKAIVVNLGHTNSKVFDSVWRMVCDHCVGYGGKEDCVKCGDKGYIEPYDLMITFCRRSDRKWNVSLYSTKPEIDCGAIAKTFGGGGHKGAAGFQCETLPFDF